MRKILALIVPALCLYSCEREMNIRLPGSEPKLIVEGSIETGLPPMVRLSRSIGFFAKIDTATFFNSFVNDAHITVSDGEKTITLREYEFFLGDYKTNFYSVDSANLDDLAFLGVSGRQYDLRIEVDGEIFTSTTTIPPVNYGLDSFWTEIPTNEEAMAEDPTYRIVRGRYNDPAEEVNRFRIFNAVNGGLFYAPYFSVNNDDIINGTTVNVLIEPGWDRFDTLNMARSNYFHLGDTLDIKLASIDFATYEFFRTLEYSYGTVGNPFAAPMIVSSNIEGGALGVWAGYGAFTQRYVVKDEE